VPVASDEQTKFFYFVVETLRTLYLADNDFETLPVDIGRLVNLQNQLFIRGSQITCGECLLEFSCFFNCLVPFGFILCKSKCSDLVARQVFINRFFLNIFSAFS